MWDVRRGAAAWAARWRQRAAAAGCAAGGTQRAAGRTRAAFSFLILMPSGSVFQAAGAAAPREAVVTIAAPRRRSRSERTSRAAAGGTAGCRLAEARPAAALVRATHGAPQLRAAAWPWSAGIDGSKTSSRSATKAPSCDT